MFDTFSEITVFIVALQIFGAIMGVLQGAMKAWVGRLGSRSRRNKGWQSASMQFSATLTFAVAVPSVLAAAGAPGTLGALVIVLNMFLPVVGNLLFIFPAWMLCSRVTELLLEPVDAAA